MTDSEYEAIRMDWRSMFVYDPTTRLMRIHGRKEHRADYAKVMFERKARYRAWMRCAVKISTEHCNQGGI